MNGSGKNNEKRAKKLIFLFESWLLLYFKFFLAFTLPSLTRFILMKSQIIKFNIFQFHFDLVKEISCFLVFSAFEFKLLMRKLEIDPEVLDNFFNVLLEFN